MIFISKKLTKLELSILSEEWRTLIYRGQPTDYLISNFGFVMSLPYTRYGGTIQKSPRILMKLQTDSSGYSVVPLYINRKRVTAKVHRLVAEAFIPNPDNKPQINHIDGNKKNNRVYNLEWVTAKENINHADLNGLRHPRAGEIHRWAKYTSAQIIDVCKLLEAGICFNDIASRTGVNKIVIYNIYSRKIWRKIAKPYSFPENSFSEPNVKYPLALKNDIWKLIDLGNDNASIRNKLSLPNTATIYSLLSDVRRRHLVGKPYVKDVRSTTIEKATDTEKAGTGGK